MRLLVTFATFATFGTFASLAILAACAAPADAGASTSSDVTRGPGSSASPTDGTKKPAATATADSVCSPQAASVCKPAAGTPLYTVAAATDDKGAQFQQPKFGGDGWLGADDALFDGYSGVLSWPGQKVVDEDARANLSAWLGYNLEGGFFIQNGYGIAKADGPSQACSGTVWVEIFQFLPDGSATMVDGVESPPGSFCNDGEKVQFKAERDGTSWAFSYRVVGPGRSTDFTEQLRHDFGAQARGQGHVMAYTELYDYNQAVERLAPITFGPVLVKTDSWKPVERMTSADDFGSERLFIRPEPAVAGVTTSAPGAKCYGSTLGKTGETIWDNTASCWASSAHCDSTTSACP